MMERKFKIKKKQIHFSKKKIICFINAEIDPRLQYNGTCWYVVIISYSSCEKRYEFLPINHVNILFLFFYFVGLVFIVWILNFLFFLLVFYFCSLVVSCCSLGLILIFNARSSHWLETLASWFGRSKINTFN